MNHGNSSRKLYTIILGEKNIKSQLYFIALNCVCIEYSQDSVAGTYTMQWAGKLRKSVSLFYGAFQFTIYNGPNNALACNKTLIQMSHTKTLKITPTYFDHQMIIIRELFDPC
jgi:hypothetical protein